jgi:hypothetical protein
MPKSENTREAQLEVNRVRQKDKRDAAKRKRSDSNNTDFVVVLPNNLDLGKDEALTRPKTRKIN